MQGWKQKLLEIASQGEGRFDDLKLALGQRLGRERPLVVVPYMGYGKAGVVRVQGRVLANPGDLEARPEASVWENLWDMYRRAESDEVPFVELEVLLGDTRTTLSSDAEGFFRGEIAVSWPRLAETAVHPVTFALGGGDDDGVGSAAATGEILVPGTAAAYGVISDIDDTLLQSYATEPLRMIRTMLSGNAATRLPFAGVAAFYRLLADQDNPFFYVSSSPWNLYDLLEDFLALHDMPSGPLLLRDWGMTRSEFLPTEHREYKLQTIRRVLDFYPGLSFILIGDNGQQDPEIYAAIADDYPGRIRAVLIRTVDQSEQRAAEVGQIMAGLHARAIPAAAGARTLALAQAAVDEGLLEARALQAIAAAEESAGEQ